jgi:hypothetical protein
MTRKLLSLLVFILCTNFCIGQGAEIYGNCFYNSTNGRITIRLALHNPTGSSTGQMDLTGMRFGFQYNNAAVNYAGYFSHMYNSTDPGLNDAGFLDFIGPDTEPSPSAGTESPASRVAGIQNSPVQKTLQKRYINRSTNDCFSTIPIPAGQTKILIDIYFTLVNNNPEYYNLTTAGYGFGTPNFIAQFFTKNNGGHAADLNDVYKEIAVIIIRQGNTNNPYQPFNNSSNVCVNGSAINPIVVNGDDVNFIGPVEGVLSAKLKFAGIRERTGYAELNWGIENNQLVDHFEIERLDHTGNFKTIGLMMADNEEASKDYTYTEKLPGSETELRYRLKVFSNDGTVSYSTIMKLNLKQVDVAEIKIIPNPVAASALLNLPAINGNYLCRIYNSEGQMIQAVQLQGSNPSLNVSRLTTGRYFVEAFHPQTGKRYYGKFTKQ